MKPAKSGKQLCNNAESSSCILRRKWKNGCGWVYDPRPYPWVFRRSAPKIFVRNTRRAVCSRQARVLVFRFWLFSPEFVSILHILFFVLYSWKPRNQRPIGFLLIDAKNFKDTLMPNPLRCMKAVNDLMPVLAKRKMQSIIGNVIIIYRSCITRPVL